MLGRTKLVMKIPMQKSVNLGVIVFIVYLVEMLESIRVTDKWQKKIGVEWGQRSPT